VVRSGCIRTGERVLDIACGTGNTALMARARGAVVAGVDLTLSPPQPQIYFYDPLGAQFHAVGYAASGSGSATIRSSDITWIEGDAENLPLPDGGFDVVVSSCGLMFAPDQQKAANEVARVTSKDGRIAIQAWTREGGVGRMFKVPMSISHHRPACRALSSGATRRK